MALSSKVGTFTTPTMTGTYAVTGLGFQPKAVLLFATPQTATGLSTGSGMMFGGASGSSEQFAMGKHCPHAQSPARQYGGAKNTRCLCLFSGTALIVEATFTSLDADGFTLNFTAVDGSAYRVHYLALGGSDVSNALVTVRSSPTSTGLQAVTGHSFRPNTLLLFNPGAFTGAANADSLTNGGLGVFAATDPGLQVGGGCRFGDNVSPTATFTRSRTDQILISPTSNAQNAFFQGVFSGWRNDGYTMSWFQVATGARFFYGASLRVTGAKSGFFQQPTSTGPQAITGLGFQPSVLLVWGCGKSASTGLQNHSCLQFGVTDGSGSGSQLGIFNTEQHNVSPSNNWMANESGSLIQYRSEVDGSLLSQASLIQFDPDGFTLDWTAVDSTPRQLYYLALGATAPTSRVKRAGLHF